MACSRRLIVIFTVFMLCTTPAGARTLVVEGTLAGTVTVKKNVTFSADQAVERFTYQFSVPSVYDNAGNIQRLDNFQVSAVPEPTEATETTDRYGNRSRKLTWKTLRSNARVAISYTTALSATISPRSSRAPFPLQTVPKSEQAFLKNSPLVQSKDHRVIERAGELTAGATSEHQAVTAILTHVADAIRYQYNPTQFDALFALTSGSGNCQNFSHLAVALLRASGIPARVSIGQVLKDKWKIPLDNKGSSLVQGMGEGLHAWIEVWYPDLGWLPCDPQQSRLFTSTRHIKFGHGVDASDVLEYWSAVPVVPGMSETLEATYSTDTVDLRLREALDQPTSYLLAGPVTAGAAAAERMHSLKPRPTVPTTGKPVAVPQKPGTRVEIGNRDFPALVEMYQVTGTVGRRSFDRETAEYATSRYLFAQAFTLEAPLALTDVGLAMRKFGGDGTVYLDVVRDDGGKPSLDGIRSTPVALEKITRRPGYYWVDFTLPPKSTLRPGKYWLVLRHSGEAIMNWFYTPGKRVNGSDDTRSTARGWQWEDVLAGEFVYRVRGVVEKP
jgi:transglutaminase-like putative cysteine protease